MTMYSYSYTTMHTYDKANQLVSSATNGKVTEYAYDATGRLIKEGDKSYAYGWLDKVLSVTENGKPIASFNYHNDGQIAQAIHNGKSEDFLWDGLALIHRGETSFINEPYVTGGNPILSSKDGVMFNDMLGSTLNIGGKAVNMTSFGESADSKAMYTGKPYIGELGYAFLFRNYRSDYGKWQTSDPLGYPDGWNNFVYCNNSTVYSFDQLGLSKWEWIKSSALAGLYGSIYWARSSSLAMGVINRLMPKTLDDAIISAFSENVLRNNQQISGYVNEFFAQKLSMFNKDSADGNYLLDGSSTLITLNMSAAWGAIVGTSTLTITAYANVSTVNAIKSVTINIECQYFDTIDWNSRDELAAKGYFSENVPAWVSFLGYLEVAGDVVQDKILSADYDIKTRWTDYRTKILE